ncbi:MAG: hypothetical protein ACLFUB_03710 [Cyclobacteriaceae bacterium]
MTKGHNKGHVNEVDEEKKTSKGQNRHLTNKQKEREQEGSGEGRRSDPDPSDGRKGKNNVG